MSSFRFKTDMVEDRSTKQKLSDKLASVDASLDTKAQKSDLDDLRQNKVFIKDFPRLSSETNDNGTFTRAFATVTDNTEIIFEKGKAYTISQGFSLNFNRITISGNGAVINSTTTVGTNLLSFGTDSRTTLTQTVTVTKGSPNFTMTDITGINVGDLLMFSSAAVNGYSDGVYGEVVAIDTTNKIVTLSTPSHKAFTSTTQYVCNAYRNIIVRGLTINCSTNKTDAGIVFSNIINALVEYCKLEGNHGRRGIGFMGINGLFQFNECNGFFDEALIDNRTGYGISVNGHNAHVYHNRLSNCKHTIASGERRFYSTNLIYEKNICNGITDSSLQSLAAQIVDMHANSEGVVINNVINNISIISSIGMMIRSDGVRVESNTFNSIGSNPSGTIKGLVLYEYAGNDINIYKNKFKGFFTYTITFESNWITSGSNIYIEKNVMDYGQIRTSFPSNLTIQNFYINKNVLSSGGIQINNTVKNGRVIENKIVSANGIFEPGILLNDSTSESWVVESNDITNMGGGAECIRFYNDGNIIKNNRLKMTTNGAAINNNNSTANNLISDNITIDYLGNLNNGLSGKTSVTVSDMQIITTSATTVATLTPSAQGNFVVSVYYSVSTNPTNVTITVSYTDHRGSQTQTLVNVTNAGTASYLVNPIMINAKTTTPITVTATASVSNNLNVSASIIPN